ncbi:MAG: penicillin-binding protein 1A [Alphaproteobacteria bacterium]
MTTDELGPLRPDSPHHDPAATYEAADQASRKARSEPELPAVDTSGKVGLGLRLLRITGALISLGALVGITALGAATLYMQSLAEDLPDVEQLADYRPPVVTRVHAGDGRLMGELARQKRVFVPFSSMPKHLVDAYVSAEDKTFWEHPGLDFMGIANAGRLYLLKALGKGNRTVGASTITQQVAKNMLLSSEQTLERKFKEWIVARRLEEAFSKEEILELYLNEIFLGRGSYGVAAASLSYFNKSLHELTIEEAAYLAGLPKAPSRYDPDDPDEYERAVNRRNYVLGQMARNGYITEDEANALKKLPITTQRRERPDFVSADYFTEEVRRELIDRFGEGKLYDGGLSVRTTLDSRLQNIAHQTLRNGLVAYDRRHGWRGPVSTLDDVSQWRAELLKVRVPRGAEHWALGVVLQVNNKGAYLGFMDEEGQASSGFISLEELKWARTLEDPTDLDTLGPEVTNPRRVLKPGDVVLTEPMGEPAALSTDASALQRAEANPLYLRQIPKVQGGLVALDPYTGRVLAMAGGFSYETSQFNRVTQAMRQPGSAIKPFVYLAALADSRHSFTPASRVLDAPFVVTQRDGSKWKPTNYSARFYGPTTLRVGIEKSRNLITVRLANYIGMRQITGLIEGFGIVENMPELLPMSLGAGETTLLRMTAAYGMILNGGKKITPSVIDRVQDRSGRVVYRHDKRPCHNCGRMEWREGAVAPSLPDVRKPLVDSRFAYQMTSMLEGVVERGTAQDIAELGRPLAGKTGTTNDNRDAWFVGFSHELVVGVYVGYDTPRSLGKKETGGKAAAPIFKQFMAEALADKPAIPFRVPSGLRQIRINPVTGERSSSSNAIWESFVPGTDPDSMGQYLGGTDSGNLTMMTGATAWGRPRGTTPPDGGSSSRRVDGVGNAATQGSGNGGAATNSGIGGLY